MTRQYHNRCEMFEDWIKGSIVRCRVFRNPIRDIPREDIQGLP
eukprot:CAMPEP_0195335086 /NCGR_PEP_ID=MMETSP0708-20121125/15301_1 /TAXON_ID=33640 /ORGANISM="Asterionellopsis glacialis, Strain CCMP134" /LENGTH=42 /DNA_ID= /DNA_START= /DNA_END= /DNA_ORIENTATION=